MAAPATPVVPHDESLADTEIATPGLPGVVDLLDAPAESLTPEERQRRAELTTSMHTELAALHTQTLELAGDLDARAARATSADARWQVERELAALKEQEQIESLRIQARYAREVGSDVLAAEIDATVAYLLAPKADPAAAEQNLPRRPRDLR